MDPDLYLIEKRAHLMRQRNFYEQNSERKAMVNDRIATMLREARTKARDAKAT